MTESGSDGRKLKRAAGLGEECELVALDEDFGVAVILGGKDRCADLDDDGVGDLREVEGGGSFE